MQAMAFLFKCAPSACTRPMVVVDFPSPARSEIKVLSAN